MKRKFLIVLLVLALAIVSAFVMIACDVFPFPSGNGDNGNSTVVTPGGDTDNGSATDSGEKTPEPEKPDDHGLKFNLLDDDTYEVIGYVGNPTEIEIPTEYNGKKVTRIGKEAFLDSGSLISVTISDGIASIGRSAFEGCDSLVNVSISDSVTSIGNNAFYGCPIERATIPTIACSSVRNSALQTVVLIGGDSIGDNAFYNCRSLTSVTIGAGITGIGRGAFSDCYRLAEVYNLSGLVITKGTSDNGYIGYYALDIYTDKAAPSKLTKENDFVIHTDGNAKTLIGYFSNKIEITIPDGVTNIAGYAFAYRSDITRVELPDSLRNIERYAFAYCGRLTNITMGNNVTDIGERAFSYCMNLTGVTIPDSVTNIGSYAFCVCRSLTNITIPSSVANVGSKIFWDCSNLNTIYCEVASQPSGWDSSWNNDSSATVIWGYKDE